MTNTPAPPPPLDGLPTPKPPPMFFAWCVKTPDGGRGIILGINPETKAPFALISANAAEAISMKTSAQEAANGMKAEVELRGYVGADPIVTLTPQIIEAPNIVVPGVPRPS